MVEESKSLIQQPAQAQAPLSEALVSTIATELVQSLDIKTITEEVSPQSALGSAIANEDVTDEQGMPNQIHTETTHVALIEKSTTQGQ